MNGIVKNRFLVIVALVDGSYRDEVTLALTSMSGGQVTIIDAVGGAENLSHTIPMFAEFTGLDENRCCRIMIASVEDEKPAERLIEIMLDAGYDFAGDDAGEIYVIPLPETVVIERFDLY